MIATGRPRVGTDATHEPHHLVRLVSFQARDDLTG